jgi:hypothetical protein
LHWKADPQYCGLAGAEGLIQGCRVAQRFDPADVRALS